MNASKYTSVPRSSHRHSPAALRLILPVLALLISVAAAIADTPRKITPVTPRAPGAPAPAQPDPNARPTTLREDHDAQGNVIFIDTVTGMEWIDTTINNKPTGMIYPKYYTITAGVNIWDPVMRLLGQDYGIGEVWGEFSFYNRYNPVVAVGLGQAALTPDGKNYTYRSPLAPYFKLGANYNILYNSNPRYQVHVGLRYGFTPFSYSVPDATLGPGYWDETEQISIPSQKSTAGYLELVAGLRVDIAKGFSLGWDVIYHTILHESNAAYGKPIYIPGYGKRGTTFSGSFSLSYTFALPHKSDPPEQPDTQPLQ